LIRIPSISQRLNSAFKDVSNLTVESKRAQTHFSLKKNYREYKTDSRNHISGKRKSQIPPLSVKDLTIFVQLILVSVICYTHVTMDPYGLIRMNGLWIKSNVNCHAAFAIMRIKNNDIGQIR